MLPNVPPHTHAGHPCNGPAGTTPGAWICLYWDGSCMGAAFTMALSKCIHTRTNSCTHTQTHEYSPAPATGGLAWADLLTPCPLHFLQLWISRQRVKNGFPSSKVCFPLVSFSIYSWPSLERLCPSSVFFSLSFGGFRINAWIFFFVNLVVSWLTSHSFRMSPENQWLPLQTFTLISVGSETSWPGAHRLMGTVEQKRSTSLVGPSL